MHLIISFLIIIFGSEGKTKVALTNTLLNKNGKFEEVFQAREKIGDRSTHYQIVETVFNGVTYRLIDLIGSQDKIAESEESVVRQEFEKLAKQLKDGVSHFLLLETKTERKSKSEILKEMLFDQDSLKHTVLVNGNFPDFQDQDERDRDLQELMEDPKVADFVKELVAKNQFLHVNALKVEDQNASHQILWNHLSTPREVNYFPTNLKKLLKTEIDLSQLTKDQLWELKDQDLEITTNEVPQLKPALNILPENWDKIQVKNQWSVNDDSGLIQKIDGRSDIVDVILKKSLFESEVLEKLQEVEKERQKSYKNNMNQWSSLAKMVKKKRF